MRTFKWLLAGAALVASVIATDASPASAQSLAPLEGRNIDLGGNVHGTIYYTAETGADYRVVTTIDTGLDSTPVRFEAVLTDGQSVKVSTPRGPGEPALIVFIHRSGTRVALSR